MASDKTGASTAETACRRICSREPFRQWVRGRIFLEGARDFARRLFGTVTHGPSMTDPAPKSRGCSCLGRSLNIGGLTERGSAAPTVLSWNLDAGCSPARPRPNANRPTETGKGGNLPGRELFPFRRAPPKAHDSSAEYTAVGFGGGNVVSTPPAKTDAVGLPFASSRGSKTPEVWCLYLCSVSRLFLG